MLVFLIQNIQMTLNTKCNHVFWYFRTGEKSKITGKERNYTCSLCPKSYYQSSHLKEHFRKHTGEKPFQCSQCTRSFACQSNLRQHLKRHEKGEIRVSKFKKLFLQKAPVLLKQRDSSFPAVSARNLNLLSK